MTLVIGWVKQTATGAQQLVVAADSRLSGAGNLDCCPKVFLLPRSDAVIAFAGDTYFAYPLVLQLSNAIQAHAPLRERVRDYPHMRAHLLRVLNSTLAAYNNFVPGMENPNTSFLMGGYSWYHKEFQIDTIHFSAGQKKFINRPCQRGIGNFGKIAFAGDWAKRALRDLVERLRTAHGDEAVTRDSQSEARFNMEPFQLLRDYLRRAGRADTIGGAPQLATIAQYLDSRFLAVYWPDRATNVPFLVGRPVFPYENIDNWIVDPDTLELSHQRLVRRGPKGVGDEEDVAVGDEEDAAVLSPEEEFEEEVIE